MLKRILLLKQRGVLMAAFPGIGKLLCTYYYQIRDIFMPGFSRRRFSPSSEKISIIIPTLSRLAHADHLPKLQKLLSIYLPRQSYKNYEVLVYCDGPHEAVKGMVEALGDHRIKAYFPEQTTGKWGNQRIRMGISDASGNFCVALNDDYQPHKSYLQTLLNGFDRETGIVYGRVIFKGEARKQHYSNLKNSYVIPNDKKGVLRIANVDMCCYMVKMCLAKKYVSAWDDSNACDWKFIEALLSSGAKAKFIDKILGSKF